MLGAADCSILCRFEKKRGERGAKTRHFYSAFLFGVTCPDLVCETRAGGGGKREKRERENENSRTTTKGGERGKRLDQRVEISPFVRPPPRTFLDHPRRIIVPLALLLLRLFRCESSSRRADDLISSPAGQRRPRHC